ncbi:MAG: GLPGLI family protein [Sediminibacterium sp.]
MKYIIFIVLLVFETGVSAQSTFIYSGRIQYERKVNQHLNLDDDSEWMLEMKKQIPKFVTDVFELDFSSDVSVYKLARENQDNKYRWGGKPSTTDIIIQNHTSRQLSIQRDIFEQTYLLQDSLRNLQWRITEEKREIAGFDCRKAVTRICDSVYVVAFYTDQIPVSSGPESFGNLPGMILGLAVPRLSITWFATRVELTTPTAQKLQPTLKGKKTNWVKYNADLQKAMKDWGKDGAQNIWKFSL